MTGFNNKEKEQFTMNSSQGSGSGGWYFRSFSIQPTGPSADDFIKAFKVVDHQAEKKGSMTVRQNSGMTFLPEVLLRGQNAPMCILKMLLRCSLIEVDNLKKLEMEKPLA